MVKNSFKIVDQGWSTSENADTWNVGEASVVATVWPNSFADIGQLDICLKIPLQRWIYLSWQQVVRTRTVPSSWKSLNQTCYISKSFFLHVYILKVTSLHWQHLLNASEGTCEELRPRHSQACLILGCVSPLLGCYRG